MTNGSVLLASVWGQPHYLAAPLTLYTLFIRLQNSFAGHERRENIEIEAENHKQS